MNAAEKFVDWLLRMGYMNEEDILEDGSEIAKDMDNIRRVAPKFYNLMMCLCDCSDHAKDVQDMKLWYLTSSETYEYAFVYATDKESAFAKLNVERKIEEADCSKWEIEELTQNSYDGVFYFC